MADNNKLELVVEVDVNKANASINPGADPAWLHQPQAKKKETLTV